MSIDRSVLVLANLLAISVGFGVCGDQGEKDQVKPASAVAEKASGSAFIASAIGDLVLKYHLARQFDGSVLVSYDGEVIYKGGFGDANREWKQPNAPDTRFYIASCAKSFTATLVMMLAEEGLIDLDAYLPSYLPELDSTLGGKIRIQYLLNHTSGLVRDWGEFTKDDAEKSCTIPAIIKVLNATELTHLPGRKFAYSNSGFAMLAAVIERVTGMGYEQVLQGRILDPLGMKNTGIWRASSLISNRAVGYDPRLMCDGLNISAESAACGVGAGGLYSTVEDLYKFDEGLLGETLLTEASKKRMHRRGRGGYGYGWYVTPFDVDQESQLLIRHSGIGGGFGSVVWRFPEKRHFITILQNNSAVPWPMANDLLNILFGESSELKPPSRAYGLELVCSLIEQGLDASIKLYDTMPKDETRKRQCDARHATGAPDSGPKDSDAAWASRTPDDRREWLLLDYGEPCRPKRIEIYENYHPGAIDRVTVFGVDGKEIDVPLEARETKKSSKGVIISSIPVNVEFDITRLKIYVDSPAVQGWNEIDAVAIIDSMGGVRWAREARASSTGADGSPHTSLTAVPHSGDLNKLGGQYLELGRVAEASVIFEFNASTHPDSIVAHESLSDVYGRLGKLELAKKAAERVQMLEETDQGRMRKRLAEEH